VETLLKFGAQYDARQNDQKTALDILRESFSPYSRKGWFILQLIEELFHSQHLMQSLRARLLRERNMVDKYGPYEKWHPDVYDGNNPMQYVLNARSIERGTLIHVAANTGDLEALKCLLEFNQQYILLKSDAASYPYARGYQAIDIDAKDEQGNTPLHYAAQHGHQEILLLLLEEGACFNVKNNRKQTPKVMAQKGKHQEVVEVLQKIDDWFEAIKQGKQLNHPQDTAMKIFLYARDRDGKTLLHWVAQQGQEETAQKLLDYIIVIDKLNEMNKMAKMVNVINALDNQGNTALHVSTTNGHAGISRLLLQSGAQFDIKDNRGKTPLDCLSNSEGSLLKNVSQLFEDIQLNRPDKVIELLHHFDGSKEDLSAILQARDEQNYILLHWAAREHYYDVVQELLKRGAVYDAQDVRFKANDWFKLIKEWMCHEKPLKFSIEEVEKDPARLAIIKNARDNCGRTPLHTNENYFRLKYLIERGADLTVQDHKGNTPLHAAVERGDIAVVKLILDQGANINARNKIDQVPLHIAVSNDHLNVVQLLLNKKADFSIPDRSGKIPLDLAREKFAQNPGSENLRKIVDLLKNK
jgi:ankyrin repeat protein